MLSKPSKNEDFNTWVKLQSVAQGRPVANDLEDYDLEGYFNSLKQTPSELGHLPDTFKKPNHPTFSDQSMYHIPVIQEGGVWNENGFTPSKHNLKNMSSGQMQQYFNEVEKPELLQISPWGALSK